jgi:RNA polymerase sigma-70 factor (ECF subfamily)
VPTVEVDPPAALAELQARAAVEVFERITDGQTTELEVEATRLALRFQAGDPTAFEQLYSAYYHDVCSYFTKMLGDRDDAEDQAQQVFVKALKALPRFEARGPSFAMWLFAIARNTGFDLMRRRSRLELVIDPHTLRELVQEDAVPSWGSTDGLCGDYDLGALVDSLPDDQRTILLLRYALGFDPAEVAEVLGRSSAAISGSRHQALVALEDALTAARHPAARGAKVRGSGRPRALPALA